MKKVFESKFIGFDESGEQITVFELESKEERAELDELQHNEFCELLNVFEDFGVMPGAIYHRYSFEVTDSFLIMTDYAAYNV